MRCPSSGKAAPAGSGGCPSCRRRRRIGEAAAIGGGGSHRGGSDGRPTLRAMREMRSPGVGGGGGGSLMARTAPSSSSPTPIKTSDSKSRRSPESD